MLMFLAGAACVFGLSLLGFLILLWRAPLMPEADQALEVLPGPVPSIDPA